jgi:predicted aspartyl protease
MVKGVFIENMPLVQVVVAWGQSVQAPFVVLDTGFTGDLQVTPEIASELGLEVAGVTKVRVANGQIMEVPIALAIAAMEGELNRIQVLIAKSAPLLGISFLSKFTYKAIVDCKHKTVALEKA